MRLKESLLYTTVNKSYKTLPYITSLIIIIIIFFFDDLSFEKLSPLQLLKLHNKI